MLSHPPYSHDLVLSHCHLFDKLKDSICGTKVEDNDSLLASVKKWPKSPDPEFHHVGIYALVLRCHNAVERDWEYGEKEYFVPKACTYPLCE